MADGIRMQLRQNQGDVFLIFLGALFSLAFWALSGLTLSSFIGINIAIAIAQVVMRGVLPLDEAIVLYLAFNIVPRILRVIRDLNLSGCRSILLMFSLSYSMVTGARAEPHISETNIQSCICAADPNVWEIRDFVVKAAAMTTSVAMAIIGVGIAGRMINRQQVLPVVPEIPAIPAAVQALPIIPAVQGNDLDDVLARAPVPTRLNSPLSWL